MLVIAGLVRIRNQRGVAQDVVDRMIKNSRKDFVDEITTSRTQETKKPERIFTGFCRQTTASTQEKHCLTHLSQSHNLPCKSGWNNGGHPTLVRNRNAPTGSCCNCRAHTLARPGPRVTGTWGHCRTRNKGTWCEHEIVVVVMANSFNKTKTIQQQLLVELCFSM